MSNLPTVNYSPQRSELRIIAAYNKEHSQSTYVIHTPPESTIGGFSVMFISFIDLNNVYLQYANGQRFTAPLSEVTIRVQF